MPLSFTSPRARDARQRGAGVTAVLGPTNTGKTHLAIERMLAHSSGVIGLPLRLLAREVYNKVVARVGSESVALITGEEKIKPAHPRYWVATAEAMPRDLDVAFLAVDEIQVGADLERGHVFTDHILNRRAREETLILGAATMRPIVEKLLPGADIVSRPRLSQLTFSGEKKITRLPRRSAIVAFSAEEVYAIAELIRRQRGGAAVVLGALSPRTRNAQVALYQSGDVDYLIATDAIGMGLNLDVDHVAFASDRKFDGYQYRKLNPAELAQIAGRAGRATRDGTFGTTGRCDPFESDLVQQLETHAFAPVRVLQWRNSDLDFASLGALQASLAVTPREEGLTRAPVGEDVLVLDHAARDAAVRGFATSRAAIARLWETCQVPDYRKIAPATHAELVTTLYGFLMREGTIPTDWFARQVEQANRTDGGIDTLSNRIAHVRTWTFVANRPDWLSDPPHWQDVTRAVEDKLSDALHERLAERFVDRRTSVLMRRLREDAMLETEIGKTGEVTVEGHVIGRLEGFVFAADASAGGSEAKALQATAQKALAGEIDARAARLSEAPDDQIVLASDGVIRWMGDAVGKLMGADEVLRPRVRLVADEQLTGAAREAVEARLDLWLKAHIEKQLGPLLVLAAAEDVTGMARGIAFQLGEALGVLDRQKVAEDVRGLDQEARATLRKYGVRFGAYHIYVPNLLKPAPRLLAAQLWALKHEGPESRGLDELRTLATGGRTSMPVDKDVSQALYRVAGYRVCGTRAVRVDILERLADLIRPALVWRAGAPGEKPAGAIDGFGFTVSQAMTSLTGAAGADFASILKSLGYRVDRRPKPAEDSAVETPAIAAAEATAADTTDASAAATEPTVEAAPHETRATDTVDTAAPASPPPASSAALLAVPDLLPSTPEPAQAAPDIAHEPAPEPAPEPGQNAAGEAKAPHADGEPEGRSESDLATASAGSTAADGDLATQATVAQVAPAEGGAATNQDSTQASASAAKEEEFIEVWRPGRPADEHRRNKPASDNRRPPRRDGRPAGSGAPAATQDGASAAPDAGAGQPDAKAGARQGQRPDNRGERGRPPQRGAGRKGGFDKGGFDKGRGESGGRSGKHPRPPRDNSVAAFHQARAAQERDKAPDPNSPFAKLAALKAQLEANKDGH